jgi:hypothetical protein
MRTVVSANSAAEACRCTEHARESNHSRHNALYSTRQWRGLSERLIAAHVGEFGWVCPGDGPDHPSHPCRSLTVDHIVPLIAGGAPFDRANLRRVGLRESRGKAADQSADSVPGVPQLTDGPAGLWDLAEHYREGLVNAHIHVCSGAHPEMAEARDFCAIFHSDPAPHGHMHANHGIWGFEDHRPCGRNGDYWCKEAVLVGVVQIPELGQRIADLPSVVWLNPFNHCPVVRIDAIEAPIPDLGVEHRSRVADRELGPVAVTAPQLGELTNDVIQCRAKVMGYFADQDPETKRRFGYRMQGDQVDKRISGRCLYLMTEAVGVCLSEASGFGIQMSQVLPGSLDLRSRAVQRMRHG